MSIISKYSYCQYYERELFLHYAKIKAVKTACRIEKDELLPNDDER